MQHRIDNTVQKALSKPIETPNPPKPTDRKQPSVRKGGQVKIEGVVYESIIVGNKEYVDIGLYRKALEAFFKASARGNTDQRG